MAAPDFSPGNKKAGPRRSGSNVSRRTGRGERFSADTPSRSLLIPVANIPSYRQRPTNENTNGLLRDYFLNGIDLSV
jgi:hypothetical protein